MGIVESAPSGTDGAAWDGVGGIRGGPADAPRGFGPPPRALAGRVRQDHDRDPPDSIPRPATEGAAPSGPAAFFGFGLSSSSGADGRRILAIVANGVATGFGPWSGVDGSVILCGVFLRRTNPRVPRARCDDRGDRRERRGRPDFPRSPPGTLDRLRATGPLRLRPTLSVRRIWNDMDFDSCQRSGKRLSRLPGTDGMGTNDRFCPGRGRWGSRPAPSRRTRSSATGYGDRSDRVGPGAARRGTVRAVGEGPRDRRLRDDCRWSGRRSP